MKIYNTKEEIWLLQHLGESSILQKNPKEVRLYTSHSQIDTTYLWQSLHSAYTRYTIEKAKLPKYFLIQQQGFLYIDRAAVYPKDIPTGTTVILQQSSPVHLERLIHEIKPSRIIADGSNFPSTIRLWEATCLKTKTPFVYTGEKGAILLSSNPSFRTLQNLLGKTSDKHSTPLP